MIQTQKLLKSKNNQLIYNKKRIIMINYSLINQKIFNIN